MGAGLLSYKLQGPARLIRLNYIISYHYILLRACLYDPGQAGRDAYRDPAHNTNSKECLYASLKINFPRCLTKCQVPTDWCLTKILTQ
jgi:hypothetical protein